MRKYWTSMWTLALTGTLVVAALASAAEPFVPGTGQVYTKVGDDFEDPDWAYFPNLPKSSADIDENTRPPMGRSRNGRVNEGAHRGTPDVIKLVPTPPGGIPGSTTSLLLQTRDGGIPGRPSRKSGQDDLYISIARITGSIPMNWYPSIVTRVYVPEPSEWDGRTGASFGFRADVKGSKPGKTNEPYWPGFFLMYRKNRQTHEPETYILVRGNERGGEVPGPVITEYGWWTLGMSFTPDGMVHFYASPGSDDLTSADYITSHYCYGFRCERLESMFYNVMCYDDGRTWSTAWIVDDPTLYYIPPQSTAQRPTTTRGRQPNR